MDTLLHHMLTHCFGAAAARVYSWHSMRIGLATTGQNYYSIVPIIHAVTAACGALVMVFLGTGNSRGYSVSTDPVSDLLRATEGGPELLHALPKACL